MKKTFKKIPEAIRRQIRIRMLAGVVLLTFFVITWIAIGRFQVSVMLLLFAVLVFLNGALMLYHCSKGRYLCLSGRCVDLERTKIFGKTKRIHVEIEKTVVSIPMHRDLNKLRIGDTVYIYLSGKAPLIHYNGIYVINHFYAVRAEKNNPKRD